MITVVLFHPGCAVARSHAPAPVAVTLPPRIGRLRWPISASPSPRVWGHRWGCSVLCWRGDPGAPPGWKAVQLEAVRGAAPLPQAADGALSAPWGRGAAALPPHVFANPHQLRGLKPASGLLYDIKTKGVGGAMIGAGRGGRGAHRGVTAGKICRNPPQPFPRGSPGQCCSTAWGDGLGGCPGCPGGMQAVAVGCRRGGLWGCSVLCSARQQEFRKPTRGECQVRLYRSQTPACLLVLLEPVSDLISLGGSCLINTHLAARRPHRPYIVSLPCSQLCGTLQECCWGGSPGGRLAVGPGAGWGGLGFVGGGRLQFKLRTRGMGLCCRRSPGCCPHLPARCRGAPR